MRERRGIALLGGTFDPVHNGHIQSAAELFEQLPVKEVRLVVAKTPPHRESPGATAEQRFDMLERALASYPNLIADDVELGRPDKSYTYDTLAHFRERLGDEPLVFVLGQDAFDKLHEWYRWQDLTDLAHLLVIARPGSDLEALPAEMEGAFRQRVVSPACLMQKAAGGVAYLSLTQWEVSATEVRRRALENENLTQLVPAPVEQYIRTHGLYAPRDNEARGMNG